MALDGQLFADWLEDWLATVRDKPVLRVKLPIAQDGRSNMLCLGSQPLRVQSHSLLFIFCKTIANSNNMLEHQHQPKKDSPTCTAIAHAAYHNRSPDASVMANGSVGERMQSEQLWQPLQDLTLGINGSCQAVFMPYTVYYDLLWYTKLDVLHFCTKASEEETSTFHWKKMD